MPDANAQLRAACEEVSRAIVADRMPHLLPSFDSAFEIIYADAPTADLQANPPAMTDVGQEAIDPETLKEMTLYGMCILPVYRLMVGILGPAVGDTFIYSLDRLGIAKYFREQAAWLKIKHPKSAPWIDVAERFCRSFVERLRAQCEPRNESEDPRHH